jgi:small subunit ribosomal protein S6
MNYYETLYIVHPALESGRLKDIIMAVEDSLKKMGGDLLAIELWGKRKLAYFIDKQKYGTYVLVQYNGEGKCTSDFTTELEHNPNVLANLTTIIDQNDIRDQEKDLDTQIAGQTREAERTEPPKAATSTSFDGDVAALGGSVLSASRVCPAICVSKSFS